MVESQAKRLHARFPQCVGRALELGQGRSCVCLHMSHIIAVGREKRGSSFPKSFAHEAVTQSTACCWSHPCLALKTAFKSLTGFGPGHGLSQGALTGLACSTADLRGAAAEDRSSRQLEQGRRCCIALQQHRLRDRVGCWSTAANARLLLPPSVSPAFHMPTTACTPPQGCPCPLCVPFTIKGGMSCHHQPKTLVTVCPASAPLPLANIRLFCLCLGLALNPLQPEVKPGWRSSSNTIRNSTGASSMNCLFF